MYVFFWSQKTVRLNIFFNRDEEFNEQSQDDRTDWEIAETLYQKGWEYYMNNCTLLTRENYQRIQEEIGFPETYEQHMSRLTHGIPNDASRMVKQIMVFINKYPVFKEKVYPMMIGMMLERVRRDPSVYIDAAFRALIDANANRDPDDVASEDLPSHPPLFETQIGTETITLPTFGNPIMTGLYSLLFVCFAQITKL